MHRLAAALALAAVLPTSLPAATVTVTDTTPGTIWDGIVEGFPGFAGRIGGNPLSVVRRGDTLQLRSVMEFPLAPLAGVTPDAIVSATLTFNIDDVLSTLGPGTDLNGQAAKTILVHFYPGDGQALLGDFARTEEPAVAVDTGPGTITDATLKQSGPVVLTVDARARLMQALSAGTPFLGVLWRTNDDHTGTSIDDGRGDTPSGPPSGTVSGARMPFLTVEVSDAPPPNCGNGTLDAGEQCDDGNVTDGDCCSRLCTFDAAGAPCSDGNACTMPDSCDGAGACVAGDPRDCDDGSTCTVDSCEPVAGCVHALVTCGDGILEAGCGEECDDGNARGADGCSSACRFDALVGGSGPRECLVRVAFATPVRDPGGAIASEQACTDGDPACDADPETGVCGFVVAGCFGLADQRAPDCAPTTSVVGRVQLKGGGDRGARGRFVAALRALVMPGCMQPVTLRVPLRRRGRDLRPGKAVLTLTVRARGVGRDRDAIRFVCRPGS